MIGLIERSRNSFKQWENEVQRNQKEVRFLNEWKKINIFEESSEWVFNRRANNQAYYLKTLRFKQIARINLE
jgi:hypothetical protein